MCELVCKSLCVTVMPAAVPLMRYDELCASNLLSNNESAVIAWAKNSRLLVTLIVGLSLCYPALRLHSNSIYH